MVSRKIIQQLESAGLEYEPTPRDKNDEEFLTVAGRFPSTVEFEIKEVYRLREPAASHTSIADMFMINNNNNEQSTAPAATEESKEFLTWTYYIYYTNSRLDRIGREFNDGGIDREAVISQRRDPETQDLIDADLKGYKKIYTTPFTYQNLKEIVENQEIEYPDKPQTVEENDLSKRKTLKLKCKVINQDKIKYYVGYTTDNPDVMAVNEKRISNHLDWMYLPVDVLLKLHDAKKLSTVPQPETLQIIARANQGQGQGQGQEVEQSSQIREAPKKRQ